MKSIEKQERYLSLEQFEKLFLDFISYPTWTSRKHEARDAFYAFLNSYKSISIRVHPSTKNRYCKDAHSFTILRVPLAVKGKLAKYRDQVVLIRCSWFSSGGWTQYVTEVYRLKEGLLEIDHSRLKQLFGDYYIEREVMTKEEEIKHYEKLVLAYAHKHYPVFRNRTSVGIIEVKEDRILFGMRGVQGVLVLSKEALRESLEGDS